MLRADDAVESDPTAIKLSDPPEPACEASVQTLLRLRRDTATPLYRQIEDQLAELIAGGRIAQGSALPAERQLAEALAVSRATIQQCYASLRRRGLIAGAGRHGSIVQRPVGRLLPGMDRLRGFTQEMREFGRRPSTRVLEHELRPDPMIAALFGLGAAARFLRLVRVRYGDDVPLSREAAWYSLDAAPFLAEADPTGSIYGQLAQHGLGLSHCDQTVEATYPTEEEQTIFGFDRPLPCLLIKRHSYVGGSRMVEYVEGVFRGDAYSYRLRLDA